MFLAPRDICRLITFSQKTVNAVIPSANETQAWDKVVLIVEIARCWEMAFCINIFDLRWREIRIQLKASGLGKLNNNKAINEGETRRKALQNEQLKCGKKRGSSFKLTWLSFYMSQAILQRFGGYRLVEPWTSVAWGEFQTFLLIFCPRLFSSVRVSYHIYKVVGHSYSPNT